MFDKYWIAICCFLLPVVPKKSQNLTFSFDLFSSADIRDTQYVVRTSFGTPRQNQHCLVSFDLPYIQADYSKYDPSKSSTMFNTSKPLPFGWILRDVVVVDEKIQLPDVTVYSLNGGAWRGCRVNFGGTGKYAYTTPMKEIIRQLQEPVASLIQHKSEYNKGKISLGKFETEMCTKEWKTYPNPTDELQIRASFSLDGREVIITERSMNFAVGEDFVTDVRTYEKLYNMIPPIDCKLRRSLPEFVFKIHGDDYVLNGEEYTKQDPKTELCSLRIKPDPSYFPDTFRIGGPFFEKYCIHFHYPTGNVSFSRNLTN